MAKRPGDIVDWRKHWDWTDKDDGPASWKDEEVQEIDINELMLPKDAKGIQSLDAGAPMKMASTDLHGNESDADEHSFRLFNKPFKQLSPIELDEFWEEMERLQNKFSSKALEGIQMAAQGGRIGYALGPPDPGGVVQDDLTTTEFMQDQGIPYGQQASGINQDVLIEKVVEEFIKRKGRRPRSIEEIKEFYFKEMAGGSGGSQKVAYNPGDYDPMMVDEYEKYKFQQEELGMPVISIDEFIQMERANIASGGLPGILGV
jgi:hypothetical protein|tara:strand:+ start:133 stop:912 length:780 start_codon:yes stop_codon:yes gene_type:complete